MVKWSCGNKEQKCSCRQTRKLLHTPPCHLDWLICRRSCWSWSSPSWTGSPPCTLPAPAPSFTGSPPSRGCGRHWGRGITWWLSWSSSPFWPFWSFLLSGLSKQGGGETWSRKKKEEAGHEGEPSWHSSQLIHPMRRSQEKLGLGFVEREHPVGREGEPSRLGVAMCQDKRFHCCRCLWLKKRGILAWKPLGTYPCNHKTLGSWN